VPSRWDPNRAGCWAHQVHALSLQLSCDGCNTITLRRYIAFQALRQEFWSEFKRTAGSANFTTANLPCAPVPPAKFIFGDTQVTVKARAGAVMLAPDGDQGVHTLREEIGTQPGIVQNQFYEQEQTMGSLGAISAEKLWDGKWQRHPVPHEIVDDHERADAGNIASGLTVFY
jgi:hypothetical protein